MPERSPRPFEVSQALYPFADNWFERNGAAMHYVEEGHGVPVVMLHGNPTWSFLYRDVIKAVKDECRAIAPDYPGFGFSAPPPGYGYTPQEHADWVKALVDELNLDRFVLVMQDWGGPIGCSVAVDRPEDVAGLVILNTWCWRTLMGGWIFSVIMGGRPLGRFLQLKRNQFATRILPSGILNDERKTPEVLKAYADPFPTPESRMGTWVFPRAIRKSGDWLEGIESRLYLLRRVPVEMVWAMKDPAFGSEKYIKCWQEHFPGAPIERLDDASHYLQEDRPDAVAGAIRRVLGRL